MIRISGLTKRYGSSVVLDDLEFTVAAREIAAVVGPSGAGKSTLARCITMLERPTSGRVEVDGTDLSTLGNKQLRFARRSIGTVFQSANLLSRLTVAQNVALPLDSTSLDDRERHQRVRDLLDRVGLLHRANHFPAQLSGGQRQRVGIARSLVLQPSVLLSDEATSGLDPDATASILALITDLRAELGLTVVLITHEMDVVRSAADTVAHLDKGRMIDSGTVADIVRAESPLSRALLPLPAAGSARPGDTVYELRYGHDTVDPTWPALVSSTLQAEIAVLGALVERIGSITAGRASIGLPARLEAGHVVAAFAACGIYAVPAELPLSRITPSVDRIGSFTAGRVA